MKQNVLVSHTVTLVNFSALSSLNLVTKLCSCGNRYLSSHTRTCSVLHFHVLPNVTQALRSICGCAVSIWPSSQTALYILTSQRRLFYPPPSPLTPSVGSRGSCATGPRRRTALTILLYLTSYFDLQQRLSSRATFRGARSEGARGYKRVFAKNQR